MTGLKELVAIFERKSKDSQSVINFSGNVHQDLMAGRNQG